MGTSMTGARLFRTIDQEWWKLYCKAGIALSGVFFNGFVACLAMSALASRQSNPEAFRPQLLLIKLFLLAVGSVFFGFVLPVDRSIEGMRRNLPSLRKAANPLFVCLWLLRAVLHSISIVTVLLASAGRHGLRFVASVFSFGARLRSWAR
jgi:hypothetical protein